MSIDWIEYMSYFILFIVGWFALSVLLRRVRIWQRRRILRRLQLDFGKTLTEREVFGDELELHL
jgi:hypothetical protein